LNKISSSTSVFTLVGHKEDELSKQIAEHITKITKRVTVVIMGLHIEKATLKDINCLIKNIKKTVDRLIKKIKLTRISSMECEKQI
jgi:hypothetical protein